MTSVTEMRIWILSKASEDDGFRARLIADPKATISHEFGADIPDGVDVVVHEESVTSAHLVLPPSPILTDAEPESIAGTANWGPFAV